MLRLVGFIKLQLSLLLIYHHKSDGDTTMGSWLPQTLGELTVRQGPATPP